MTTRINLSLHGVTAADLGKLCILSVSGSVSFAIGDVYVFFDGPDQFAAWLARLQELAAATPQVAELLTAQADGTRRGPVERAFGLCGERDGNGYTCTEPAGHEGEHVATGSESADVYARWTS